MSTKDCNSEMAMSWPCVGEAGATGDWRNARPVLDESKCLAVQRGKVACMQCWMFCPDAVISKSVPPNVELKYCKGCGICVEVCPAGAISMVSEHDAMNREQAKTCEGDCGHESC